MENTTPQQGQSLQPLKIGENGLFVMRDQIDVQRVARHLLETRAVPASLREPQQVAMAVQGLNSLGLNPYAAIRQVAFINGAMTLWGDLPLALARKSGQLEDFEEFRFVVDADGKYVRQCFENSNAHLEAFGVVCRLRRLGQRDYEIVYTQEDARKAGLWGKTPTWQRYPARMMQMRARSQALKDVFSDALAGVQIQEFDIEGIVPSEGSMPASENHAQAGLVVKHVDSVPRRRGRPPAVNRAEDAALKFVDAVAAGRNHEPPTQERQRHEAASFVDDDLDGLESTDHLHDDAADDEPVVEPQVELSRTQQMTQRVNAARPRR